MKLATEPEGEILVKCPGMLLGYYQDTSATKAAFDDSGYFKTGDIGRCEGKYWFIKGRASMDSKSRTINDFYLRRHSTYYYSYQIGRLQNFIPGHRKRDTRS